MISTPTLMIAVCPLFLAVSAASLGQPPPTSADASFEQTAALGSPLSLGADSALESAALGALAPESDWRVDFNTWIWLMGVDGDVGARGLKTNVSADFGDVLDASDSLFAFSGRLEIGKGNWSVFIDGMYADIGVEDVSGPLGFADIDITFEQTLLDFGLMYRIGEWQPSGDASAHRLNTTLDLYVGGRYTNLELELDPANAPSRSKDVDWVDPIVGAKLVLPLAESWHMRATADVGGFGVESDFTWSVTGVLGYDFKLFELPATICFGYRALGQDFTEGSGADEFTWDVVQHGPILGLSLRF